MKLLFFFFQIKLSPKIRWKWSSLPAMVTHTGFNLIFFRSASNRIHRNHIVCLIHFNATLGNSHNRCKRIQMETNNKTNFHNSSFTQFIRIDLSQAKNLNYCLLRREPEWYLVVFGLVFVRSCIASDRPKIRIAIWDTPTKINMSNEQKQMEIYRFIVGSDRLQNMPSF